MANSKAKRRRQRKQTRPQRRREEVLAEQRRKVLHATELQNQVKALFKEVKDAGVEVNRENLAVMAAVETLTDLLVDQGFVERIDVNLGRLHYLEKYLADLRPAQSEAA